MKQVKWIWKPLAIIGFSILIGYPLSWIFSSRNREVRFLNKYMSLPLAEETVYWSHYFGLDPVKMLSTKYIESGKKEGEFRSRKNRNGTYDYGVYQLNSVLVNWAIPVYEKKFGKRPDIYSAHFQSWLACLHTRSMLNTAKEINNSKLKTNALARMLYNIGAYGYCKKEVRNYKYFDRWNQYYTDFSTEFFHFNKFLGVF